jgi:hypothetical protein
MDRYCPIVKNYCLEECCAMYHLENDECILFTACNIFEGFQKILQKQIKAEGK